MVGAMPDLRLCFQLHAHQTIPLGDTGTSV